MIDKLKKAIFEYEMFKTADVTVAISGGADSVALLLALNELKSELGLTLSAAHLNHSLRGAESDGDEAFCRALCERLSIPFLSERADIGKIAEETGESIELAARNVRYEFLNRISNGIIATAHTADDNLETVIFNIARGTGLSGLCGIPPKRGNIVRPLIFCRRSEIEKYLEEKGQDWRTDSTNNEDIYKRNYIRHNIIPHLEKLNPSVKERVSEMCEGLRNDNEFIKKTANRLINEGAAAKEIANAYKSVGIAALAELCNKELSVKPCRKTLEKLLEICNKGEGKLNFEQNSICEIIGGRLVFYKNTKSEAFSSPLSEIIGCEYKGYKFSLVAKDKCSKEKNVNKKFLTAALDYDKIPSAALVRNRKNGDRIRLAGRNCSKSLPKLFNEIGIAEHKRDDIPILEFEDKILAAGTFGIAECVKITDKTKNILLIERL